MAVTALDVRDIALQLPRAYEAWVRDYRKFRVGQIVFASVSPDETELGFGFPREERDDLIASEPDKFFLPRPSDLRYRWVCAWLAALDRDELNELIVDAWAMCVPKSVAAAYFTQLGDLPPGQPRAGRIGS
ncbi:MAG TPA: MmcQ/YjbR family DNA-binding protein [Intrasporangium sp.]|nr:MmcQ/YjbR family DNA-binding protein [Intrasporangium sp.]